MDELSKHFFEMAALAAKLHGRALPKFAKNDVRNAFHYGVGNVIAKYATSIGMTHAADVLVKSESDDRVIKQLRNVFGHRPSLSQYLAGQRGYLSLGVWHQFEDSLRTLYREAVPQAVRDADIAAEQARYHKPSKRPHIGIPTLWKRVAELAGRGRKPNKRALNRHWAVVDFWSAARNTIHTNTFYFGQERSLKIGKRTIFLRDGQPTDFNSIALQPAMIGELEKAFRFLRSGIRTKRAIITLAGRFPDPYEATAAIGKV